MATEDTMEESGKFYGIYRGFVSDNEDPEFLGRLKITVPQVYDDAVPDYWAWPKGMFAGNQIGAFFIPEEGDGVWISFENGDPRYPVWEYGWFATGEVPTAAKNNGVKPTNKVLQTKSGHRLEMDDFKKVLRVTDAYGNIIEMNETGVSIISSKISLGTLNGSAEPAVLGDTLHELLTEFMTDMGSLMSIVTSSGTTASINTASNWAAFEQRWTNEWANFKSSTNSID